MESTVTLLYWESLDVSERNVMKIVQFLGGTIQTIRLAKEVIADPDWLRKALPNGERVITSARTLSKIGGDDNRRVELKGLKGLAMKILVYGFEPTQIESEILQELTAGSLLGVESLPSRDRKIAVAGEFHSICKQFSGLSFDAPGSGEEDAFVRNQDPGGSPFSPLISIDAKPFFVRLRNQDCELMLLASRQIADIDAVVPTGTSILKFFPAIVPVMMFLRSGKEHKLWHNSTPTACFIVDDPLLKKQYGFLNYQKLLDLMEQRRFCTSIAFIPWNCNRSERRVAEMFVTNPHRYTLCVHGCDHTRGEFGVADADSLREKAGQALERMNMHQKLSGVSFDDVMVFPQGIFSTAAMEALESSRYLAAVNSSPYPVDAGDALTLRDLLDVAVTRFSNFPLFTRRYPQHLAETAFDLFMGKPALVVEHHGFFRDGYEALGRAVDRLHQLDERLQWANLATTCSRACLEKTADNGDTHIVFFTDRFYLRNETDQTRHYVLIRRSASKGAIRAVVINGRTVNVEEDADCVKTSLSLKSGETAEVRIERHRKELRTVPRRQDRIYQAKVFVRRCLSEFRDNYVDSSRFLSGAARNS